MHKRKDLLDKIKYKFLVLSDIASEMFLRMLWDYYVKSDIETGDQLSDIFYTLYMSNKDMSYDSIVYKYSIGLSTLNRYRIRFNKLALKLLPPSLENDEKRHN